jgi:hypothetical protein
VVISEARGDAVLARAATPAAWAFLVRVAIGPTLTGCWPTSRSYSVSRAAGEARTPAVVMVLGNPDVGVQNPLGCQLPEMGMAVSWGQLLSASGIVGVVYETRNPASDVNAVLSYLREVGEPNHPETLRRRTFRR